MTRELPMSTYNTQPGREVVEALGRDLKAVRCFFATALLFACLSTEGRAEGPTAWLPLFHFIARKIIRRYPKRSNVMLPTWSEGSALIIFKKRSRLLSMLLF